MKIKRSSVIIFLIICALLIIASSITVVSLVNKCGATIPGSSTDPCDEMCVYDSYRGLYGVQSMTCTYIDGGVYQCAYPTTRYCTAEDMCVECERSIGYSEPITIACCAIPGEPTCIGCDGEGQPSCDNDGVCEGGLETPQSCPFDCSSCLAQDADGKYKRNTKELCEGPAVDGGVTHPECRWCPVPGKRITNPGFPYPYVEPDQTAVSNADGSMCVNITNDPFNCGKCGFKLSDGTHDYATYTSPSNGGQGFCRANAPFCVNKVCKFDKSAETKKWVEDYIYNHTTENPYYYPYTVTQDANTGAWKADTVSGLGAITPAYSSQQFDENPAACTAVSGGTIVEGIGCCGNHKCRMSGRECQIDVVCDGSQVHNANDASKKGEVFKTPMFGTVNNCFTPHPIASINNEFVKCIDSGDEEEFARYVVESINKDADVCLPEGIVELTNSPLVEEKCQGLNNYWGAGACPNEGNGAEHGGDWQYSCVAGKYPNAAVRVYGSTIGETSCGMHDANAIKGQTGDLVCVSESPYPGDTSFGFASIVNGGMGLSFKTSAVIPFFPSQNGDDQTNTDAWCPAPVYKWKDTSGNDVSVMGASTNIAMVPCPGTKSGVTIAGASSPGIFLSGVRDDYGTPKLALFCIANQMNDGWASGFYALDYVKGNGTKMGNVSGHEYICMTDLSKTVQVNKSRAYIGVCCGDRGCSDIPGTISTAGGGIKYNTGDVVKMNNTKFYCLADGRWSNDLDYTYTQDACSRNAFSATGTYCCSEGDDTVTWLNESYNDRNNSFGSSVGACFKGIPQANNLTLRYKGLEYPNVFVFNGSFRGCGFNTTIFTPEFESGNQTCTLVNGRLTQSCLEKVENWPNPGINFTAQSTWRTHQPLISRDDYCTLINTSIRTYYCSFANAWNDSGGQNLSHKSIVPADLMAYFKNLTGDNTLFNMSCCLPNQCWSPLQGSCIEEQTAGEYYQVNPSTIYKCLQGEWVNVLGGGRLTPDKCFVGFCPVAGQCLYNIAGSPADNGNVNGDPQCLNNGQYKDDYLCNNGTWSSRTKMLAEKLVSIANSNNFILICGPKNDVIINTQQNTGASNNWCILNSNGQRIIGTTLNQVLFNATYPFDFITTVDQSYSLSYPGAEFSHTCIGVTKDFQKCVDLEYLKLYYDDDYKMVIMSNEDVSLSQSLGDIICDALPNWLKWLCPKPPIVEQSLANLSIFNKLYASKQGSVEVFGVAEKTCNLSTVRQSWSYTFNYTGLSDADLSYLVNGIAADTSVLSPDGKNVFIVNPRKDAWAALTLLRNPEQE